jgi:hypothetical protein
MEETTPPQIQKHALLIGFCTSKINNPIISEDLFAVGHLLYQKYGFEITRSYNASR